VLICLSDIKFQSYMKKSLAILLGVVSVMVRTAGAGTVEDVVAAIDPATGAAKDTTTAFTVDDAIVSARLTQADGKVLAFIQPKDKPGVAVLASAADGAKLIPRNEISITGTLAAGPYGWAVLAVKEGSVTVLADNKPFGAPTPVTAAQLADASALVGKFVKLPDVTFEGDKIDAKGGVKVKDASGAEVSLLVCPAADGRAVPAGTQLVYGVPVKVGGAWKLLAARFLPADGKATLAMAEKYTCTTCHNADIKVVGPAYRDVANRYRDDNDAVAKFVAQMDAGGMGKWGQVPMTPFKGKVPPEDEKKLAEWIWSYRWDWILAQ